MRAIVSLSEAQQRERRKTIGASDAPAILGLSPWRTPLDVWREKRHGAPETESALQWFGSAVEDVLADFCERDVPGLKLRRKNQPIRCADTPWMTALLDRVVVGDKSTLVELKTANQFVANRWRDGVPEYYVWQAHHQMACAPDAKRVVFCALIGGIPTSGWRNPELVVERSEGAIKALRTVESAFWERVQTGEPPPPLTARDMRTRWPFDTGEAVNADADVRLAVEEARKIKAEIKDAEKRLDELLNSVKHHMGHATILVDEDGRKLASWKFNKESPPVTDWRAVASALAERINDEPLFSRLRAELRKPGRKPARPLILSGEK